MLSGKALRQLSLYVPVICIPVVYAGTESDIAVNTVLAALEPLIIEASAPHDTAPKFAPILYIFKNY